MKECNQDSALPDLPVSDERVRLHRTLIDIEAMLVKVEGDIAVVMDSEDEFDAQREKRLMRESDALNKRHQLVQAECVESYALVMVTLEGSRARVLAAVGDLERREYEQARLAAQSEATPAQPDEQPAILLFPVRPKKKGRHD